MHRNTVALFWIWCFSQPPQSHTSPPSAQITCLRQAYRDLVHEGCTRHRFEAQCLPETETVIDQKRVALLESWSAPEEPWDALRDRSDGAEYASYRARAPSVEITGYAWREFPKTAYLFSLLAHYLKLTMQRICAGEHCMRWLFVAGAQYKEKTIRFCATCCARMLPHTALVDRS
jgi:hypothetical protein